MNAFYKQGNQLEYELGSAGIDIGSTTVKLSILNKNNEPIYCNYKRHQSDLLNTTISLIDETPEKLKTTNLTICTTGSGAIDLSRKANIYFEQEVIACTKAIKTFLPKVDVAIELGGEDAKITFFDDASTDQRMNETCAGGTGAFIDQMAQTLKTDAAGINKLSKNHKTVYPIAARCGVFAKTDIMPLLNDGVSKEDIAASILQAVVNQTIGGLARGHTIRGNVCFLGGPLFFLSELRNFFIKSLKLKPENVFFPDNAHFFVSFGAALLGKGDKITLKSLKEKFKNLKYKPLRSASEVLPPLFVNEKDYEMFIRRHNETTAVKVKDVEGDLFLGVDAGSTTTKSVLINKDKAIVYSYYGSNDGTPLQSAINVLKNIYEELPRKAHIAGACITGYGEALIKAALNFDHGEVETIAHYKAAYYFNPKVSFILDIGGQDMKCIYVKNGLIDKIALNEACSSGCGSFVQSCAKSMNYELQDFAQLALFAKKPADLGSRCTVFMNSKIKQVQKEGTSAGNISAGLDYSIIKNALYKVIKINNPEELGGHIVVQGGTFFNNGVLRATEILLKTEVIRPNIAGLMGAFGSAIIAMQNKKYSTSLISKEKLAGFVCKMRNTRCKGCENKCLLNITVFPNGKTFISGNRCENVLQNKKEQSFAFNMFDYKYKRLFSYYKPLPLEKAPRGEIGIPRVLNMYENYPFWFAFFTKLGFRVVLSDQSSNVLFNSGLDTISSQTVCFPAKMVHGHIENLVEKGIKIIFYPCIPYEVEEFKDVANHYNCPIVGSYPEVIRLNMSALEEKGIKFLQPFLPFDNIKRLIYRLAEELKDFNITKKNLVFAMLRARAALNLFKKDIRKRGTVLIREIKETKKPAVILAGRPYHIDPAINHGIADLIVSYKVIVLSEDSVANLSGPLPKISFVDQWMYHSRLYRAANLATKIDSLELIQLNSFGCGLDAITMEQTEEILSKSGKIYTVLKIDEGSNLGAAKIRIRSLLAAIKERKGLKFKDTVFEGTKVSKFSEFTKDMKDSHTILCPQLSPVHFRLAGSVMRNYGIKLEVLPEVNKADIEEGLRYVNNDACYPTIVVVGQLINALKSGRYDINKTAMIISQTGGGCRATNYASFLRKAAEKAGFKNVPVISLGTTDSSLNKSLGISFSMLKDTLLILLYGDLLMRLSNRMRPYEVHSGQTDALVETWLMRLSDRIGKTLYFDFKNTVKKIVKDFDGIVAQKVKKPRVGIVGEILVKFHPYANNNLVSVLEKEEAEIVVPDMTDFINYCILDDIYKHKYLAGSFKNKVMSLIASSYIERLRSGIRKTLKKSKHFHSYQTTKDLAHKASDIISVCNQTGEGWLLTAEMLELIEDGVKNIVCVQPFGCLPNHITGKGVMKELKRRYNDINIISVDYDPGVSEVNQINRIKLLMSVAHQNIN
ncbi:MAG: acyl-CoA dehydratase activase-related protein [Candidatus Endomicrobiellum trichonymphae]|uniref:acyl-CoA dehydratase activase-related protein n=1 Tax=Endomicrobium trichonymphae TaxID=1408204 RepID=UPI0027D3A6E7|nr:MAG: acyl-CoA dehydratase activase-related protein [Candidatus Endomicrobium trichonymphae]